MKHSTGRDVLFLLIRTLRTFWAKRNLILLTFFFVWFLISRITGAQMSAFSDYQISGLPDAQISTWTAGQGPDGRTGRRTICGFVVVPSTTNVFNYQVWSEETLVWEMSSTTKLHLKKHVQESGPRCLTSDMCVFFCSFFSCGRV